MTKQVYTISIVTNNEGEPVGVHWHEDQNFQPTVVRINQASIGLVKEFRDLLDKFIARQVSHPMALPLNMHDDHIASCLCCNRLISSDYGPDLSDVTPGMPMSIECGAGYFSYDHEGMMAEMLRNLHTLGRTCKAYTPKV